MNTAPMLFSPPASHAFAERVASSLGIPLGEYEWRPFEDGEHKMRPLESVRGRDVYVIHSLYGEPGHSVCDKLCELLFFVGALVDASAARVSVVAPYLCYARKDRRSQARDPVTTRYVAQLFEAVGATRCATLDVHNVAAYQNAFRVPTEHLEANGLLAQWFATHLRDTALVVVSPDAGGVRRAEDFRGRLAKLLGRPVEAAFAGKLRAGGIVTGKPIVGDLDGRCAIIVDDLIGTGTTLAQVAAHCRALGASAVHAAATHGLFLGEACEKLGGGALESVVVTDSVAPWRVTDGPLLERLSVLDSAPLFAEAIARMHADAS
ncbi:ribose-phosphate diphosphokinase [Paraburkholderia mimosarum]|uniref:ribose-phosphate diphosphokinase n=1 Tax=Paraburkholderia mimosarum TaxID=312026 RepID=UPI000403F221|nr:ribose-phosphate pyrophosphokinase [Paraburkholderia mimosarum]